ncbi:hypothetical protein SDC9_176746 [bioreactor metagenome]|uniref:Uncharacterized protein n=1 Tax=bioreactor metagenome TaxID=1076179 RepID=A0A645GZ17_9ZZZZ
MLHAQKFGKFSLKLLRVAACSQPEIQGSVHKQSHFLLIVDPACVVDHRLARDELGFFLLPVILFYLFHYLFP